MVVVRLVTFVIGAGLVWSAMSSAIRTMVVPRAQSSAIAQATFGLVRGVLRARLGPSAEYAKLDRVMALYAPLSLMALPAVWLLVVLSGYTGMYWALGGRTLRTAFTLSGSSLLTLGFSSAGDLPSLVLAFTEAGVGLGLLALLISYLPTMYATFNRRELAVALLEVRADTPPSGTNMIVRYHRIGWHGGLTAVWKDWEMWFADVAETHTSQPSLNFFRSPDPRHSWVTAAGAVLDAASLVASTVDGPRDPEAQLCVRAGYVALRSIADYFKIDYDSDPSPDDPISISRQEYDEACQRLREVGVQLKRDRDQAWRDFAGWRVNYDEVLVALAALTMAPPAPWSSDRTPTSRRSALRRRPRPSAARRAWRPTR